MVALSTLYFTAKASHLLIKDIVEENSLLTYSECYRQSGHRVGDEHISKVL